MSSLYEIPVTTIDGTEQTLEPWRGQVLLIVNVASQCGFTPQYAGLEALHRAHAAEGFSVLGFPCNQFGEQEPGDEQEIRRFCSLTYYVTFPLFAKVEVNGADAHPLVAELKKRAPGLLGSKAIKWNFTKFLIADQGRVVRRFSSSTAPQTLAAQVEALL